MVLQRDAQTKVWGSGATAGAQVNVSIVNNASNGFAWHASTTASADGKWKVTLSNIPFATSATLKASDRVSTIELNDVAIGDVLLCG